MFTRISQLNHSETNFQRDVCDVRLAAVITDNYTIANFSVRACASSRTCKNIHKRVLLEFEIINIGFDYYKSPFRTRVCAGVLTRVHTSRVTFGCGKADRKQRLGASMPRIASVLQAAKSATDRIFLFLSFFIYFSLSVAGIIASAAL